jgi:hypothetical protein
VRCEAQTRGWLNLLLSAAIAGLHGDCRVFARTPHLPGMCVSTVEPLREQILGWLTVVPGTTIHAALRRNHG